MAEPTRDDVDALVGPATPHFAYQIRARLRELVAGLPEGTRGAAATRSRRWSASTVWHTPRRRPTKALAKSPDAARLGRDAVGRASRRAAPAPWVCAEEHQLNE